MERTIKDFKYQDFTDKNGNLWYQVWFESDETAKWGTKKELSKGMIIDCDLEDNLDKNNNTYQKVKLVQKEQGSYKKSGGGGSYKQEPFEHKAAGFSAGYCKDLIIADKIKLEDLGKYHEIFYQLMIAKKVS